MDSKFCNINTLFTDKALTVGVIGYGRFGKLWATLLSHMPAIQSVLVYDPYISISLESNSNMQDISIEKIIDAHIIFFCVPISKILQSIKSTAPYIHRDAIVCDTCSVKEVPLRYLENTLPATQQIVGLHPLFGPDSFKRTDIAVKTETDNFDTVIVCNQGTEDPHYQVILQLFQSINLSVKEMTAQVHDEHILYTQCLTHFLGRALGTLGLSYSLMGTKGYNSLLEIIEQTCNDSYELFLDMQKYNKGSLQMQVKLIDALSKVMQDVITHTHIDQ